MEVITTGSSVWVKMSCDVADSITEPAPLRQILEHVGEISTTPAIAPARSPPLEMNGQQLAAPEAAFERITKKFYGRQALLHQQYLFHGARLFAQQRADLDAEQAFCYSSPYISKLVNGVFTE